MTKIYGNYEKTVFQDNENNLSVFTVKTGGEAVMCLFDLPNLPKGFPLAVEGEFEEDLCYGKQFRVFDLRFEATRDTTSEFLNSKFISGLYLIKAEVLKLGDDCIDVALNADTNALSEKFAEVTKIKFREFFGKIKDILNMYDVYAYIRPFGGTYRQAEKICDRVLSPLSAIKEDIFAVGEKAGLSFSMCDAIYKKQGGFEYEKRRLVALVTCAMCQITQRGHTFCSLETLSNCVSFVVSRSAFPLCEISYPMMLRAVMFAPKILVEKSDTYKIYRKDLYYYEKNIVANLKRMTDAPQIFTANDMSFSIAKVQIAAAAKEKGIEYSKEQMAALDFVKSSGVKILTGGPGTGKTSVMDGMIKLFKRMYPEKSVLLCAPTGRASQKLSDTTGEPACTIHRALNITPYEDSVISKDENSPLSEDLIIVDEMSMTDTMIFSLLLGATKTDATLVLVGDPDQLPSVGAGNVLHDLIKSKKIEVNNLTEIHRQYNLSSIVKNAGRINVGEPSLLTGPDFEIIQCVTDAEINNEVRKAAERYFDKNDPFSFQVLSSTKKGLAGTVELNKTLKKVCNSSSDSLTQRGRYSVGDKVIMNKNNYSVGFVNGDTGLVKNVLSNEMLVDIKGTGSLTIPSSCYSDIALGFAITIHKSQGTEYDVVTIVLPKSPSVILKRNLLYTAVTRAKKKVILITQPGVIDKTVSTLDTVLRKTDVCYKLTNGISSKIYNWGERYVV